MHTLSPPARVAIACALLAGCTARDVGGVQGDSAAGAPALATGDSAAVTNDVEPARADGGPRTAVYLTAVTLGHVADSLARGSTSGHVIGHADGMQYVESRRVSDGVPEVHDRWTDVTFVQAGRATLRSGGTVSGSHALGGGEHRGGAMSGATTRPVEPGDVMIIPAGIPHQYLLARGDTLRYVTIKVAAR